MVQVWPYAKRRHSSGDIDLVSSPVNCGFTPINQRASLPSYLTPVDRIDSRMIQEDELPSLRSDTTTRGKKRAAGHLPTASVTAKKPRKVSQPRKPESAVKASGLSNREISQGFVQSKSVYKGSLSIEADSKVSNRDEQKEVTVLAQAANVDARVSSETMRKLDAFRYQAGDQTRHHEGLSHTCQDAVVAQCIDMAASTGLLVEADTMEIHEDPTDQDDRTQIIFQQDSGSDQGTHEYPFESTHSPKRSPNIAPSLRTHESASGKVWPTTSSGISSNEGVGEQTRCSAAASPSAFKQTFSKSVLEAPLRTSHVLGALKDTALNKTSNSPEDDDIYEGLSHQELFSGSNIGTVNH